MPLSFAEQLLEQMASHAIASYPHECCGMGFGPVGQPDRVTDRAPIENIQGALHAQDPGRYTRDARTAYTMDAGQQSKVQLEAESRGLELRVFYHSHPDHGAYFSGEDRALAAPWEEPLFPGVAYVVLSVVSGRIAEANAFVWSDGAGDFAREPLEELRSGAEVDPLGGEPACVLDLVGTKSPRVSIEARDCLHGLAQGSVLELTCDDAEGLSNLLHYCRGQGFRWVQYAESGERVRIRILKS